VIGLVLSVQKRKQPKLPTFVGIGPARTTTTWLHAALQGHVGLPRGTKETDFFSNNYSLGLDWYFYLFRGYPPSMVLGEITPTYFDDREASGRMAHDLTNCRIVCSLRDPVARIYSHYRLLRSEGWITRQTFLQALEHHSKWIERPGNLLGANRYAFHLKRWFNDLGLENVLVTFLGDLEADSQQYLDHITDFIGISRIALERTVISNRSTNQLERAPAHPHLAARARRLRDARERKHLYRAIELLRPLFKLCSGGGELFPPIDQETDRMLRERFRSEIEDLETLLQRDLAQWKTSARY
jgi:hypothetical protein